jgi:Bor protein
MPQYFSCLRNMVPVWLVSGALLLNSCYTYRVATQAQAGAEASKPVTAHSLFWGLVQKPKDFIRTPVCDSLGVNGMAEVTIKTNLGYAFITVVTLGIWSPMKVQWKCGKPCKKTGTL